MQVKLPGGEHTEREQLSDGCCCCIYQLKPNSDDRTWNMTGAATVVHPCEGEAAARGSEWDSSILSVAVACVSTSQTLVTGQALMTGKAPSESRFA